MNAINNEIMEIEINPLTIPVHPDADIFPMLPDDEMAELADDIRANGLNEPLVIGKAEASINTETGEIVDADQWVLIDGRNRREACRIAGITPHYRILESDPKAYIVSANINRRHMTKGQRAMAVALVYPEPKRGVHSELKNSTGNPDKADISRARTVFRTLPDLAPQVLSGAMPLNEAYKKAQDTIKASQSDEAKFSRLKAEAPDLASLVTEERLSLTGAIAELEERERTAEAQLIGKLNAIHDLVQNIRVCSSENGAALLVKTLHENGGRYRQKFMLDPSESVNLLINAFENANVILNALKGFKDAKN